MASTLPGPSPVPHAPSLDALRANCARLGIPVPKIGMNAVLQTPIGPGTYVGSHGQVQALTVPIDANVSAVIGDFGRPVLRLNSDGASANRAYFNGPPAITGDITVLCVVVNKRQFNGTNVCAVGKWNTGGSPGTNDWFIGLNFSVGPTDYKPYFAIEIGSTATIIEDTNAWALGERLVLCAVRNATSMKLYRGGAEVASGTCGTGAINNNIANIKFGEIGAGTGFNTQADYELVLIWDSALPPKVIAEISADPMMLWVEDEDPVQSTLFVRDATAILSKILRPVQRVRVPQALFNAKARRWQGRRILRHASDGLESCAQIASCVLNLDVTRCPPQADDTNFNSVLDFSTNKWHFSAVFSTAPKYRTGGQNGKPFARFAGNGFLYENAGNTTSGLNLNSGYTIVVVGRSEQASGAFFGKCTTGAVDNTRRKLELYSGAHAAGADGRVYSNKLPRAGQSDVVIHVCVVTDDTHVSLRLNGRAMDSVSAFLASQIFTGASVNNSAPGCFGAAFSSTTSESLVGDIYEVAIFNEPLSDANLSKVEHFLSEKYNIKLLGYKATSYGIHLEKLPQAASIDHWLVVEQGVFGVADDAAVANLYPLAGTGPFAQGSPTLRPVLRAAPGTPSRKYLDPDGSDDYMATGSGASELNASVYTSFLVAQRPSGGANTVSKGNTGDAGAGRRNTYYADGATHWRGPDASAQAVASSMPAVGDWFVYGFGVTNSTTVKFQRGDSTLGSIENPTPGANFAPTGTNSSAATLFCTFPGGVEGGGSANFAGFIHLNVVLSDVELTTWMQALGYMFGFSWGSDPTAELPKEQRRPWVPTSRSSRSRALQMIKGAISRIWTPIAAGGGGGGGRKGTLNRGLNRGLNRW